MVGVLASSAVDRVFEPRSGQTKDYKTCICCFSAKHAVLRWKSKDCMVRNMENVSEWTYYKNLTKHVGLLQSRTHHHLIEINLFLSWNSWNTAELALNNDHSPNHVDYWLSLSSLSLSGHMFSFSIFVYDCFCNIMSAYRASFPLCI